MSFLYRIFQPDDPRRLRAPDQVSVVTTLRAPGATATILIQELQDSGFKAETTLRLKPGTSIRVLLPNLGEVSACVISSAWGKLKAEFSQPLAAGSPPSKLLELIGGSSTFDVTPDAPKREVRRRRLEMHG